MIAAVYTDAEGHAWLHRVLYIAVETGAGTDTDVATAQCRAVAGFLEALHLPAVRLEVNGLGRFLPALLRRELARAGLACGVIEHNSRRPKEHRILAAFDARLAAGALHAHKSLWTTPFLREMREWRPDGRQRGHDDGLDAVAGCLLAEPVRLGTPLRPARASDWRPGAAPVRARSDFAP